MTPLVLPAGAVLCILLVYLYAERPFSSVNRANRRAERALKARVAELIERGYSEYRAEEIARHERTREAERVSKLLIAEGLES